MNHPDPEVVIGIPTLNGPERLRSCLTAIRRYTPWAKERLKVLVVDDCSTPDNLGANKSIVHQFGIELLMHETRLGVATGWNHLTQQTKAPYVILMNDDVEVVPDWYEALVFTLKNNPDVGMVGLSAFQGVNSRNFTPPPIPSYNEARMQRGHKMISSNGYLFGFRREHYDEIGGFDERFFLFYEEVDFGYRLLIKNHPSFMLSYPIVIHQGGASTSDRQNVPDANAFLVESREKFIEKHGGNIQELRDQWSEPVWRCYVDRVEWNTMLKTWGL